MQNRDSYFDIMKGIAITFVVLGHSLQFLSTDYKTDNLFLAIIMVHMPLFMVISGRFLQKSASKYPITTYLKNKIKQLLVPSITFGCFIALFFITKDLWRHCTPQFGDASLRIFHGLWYLVSFFIICVITAIIEKNINRTRYKVIVWIAACLCIQFLPSDLVINGVKFLLPFAGLAMIFKSLDWSQVSIGLTLLAVLGFIGCFTLYDFNTSMYVIGKEATSILYWHTWAIRFLSGIFGIIIVCFFSSAIAKHSQISNAFSWLGQRTLPIYVLQTYIFFAISWLRIDLIYNFLQLLIGIIILLATAKAYDITRKNKLARIFLYGEKP